MSQRKEKIIYILRPSWLYYYFLYLAGIAFFIFFSQGREMVSGILFFMSMVALAALFRFRYRFVVTEERLIMQVGLLARNINEMKIRHIREIQTRQNPLERLLNIGTIATISAADGEGAVIFKGISDPLGVKERIYELSGRLEKG